MCLDKILISTAYSAIIQPLNLKCNIKLDFQMVEKNETLAFVVKCPFKTF